MRVAPVHPTMTQPVLSYKAGQRAGKMVPYTGKMAQHSWVLGFISSTDSQKETKVTPEGSKRRGKGAAAGGISEGSNWEMMGALEQAPGEVQRELMKAAKGEGWEPKEGALEVSNKSQGRQRRN